jgi:Immunity protein 50
VAAIENSEALTDIFGYWPSFHDAEVLRIRLDNREGEVDDRGAPAGPRLEADIHVFEITDTVTAEGFYALRHHTLVTFAFDGIADDHLQWFSHQNALSELFLEDITDDQVERLRWSVHFDSSIGVEARFKCEAIRIVSAVPYEPESGADATTTT